MRSLNPRTFSMQENEHRGVAAAAVFQAMIDD